jgi:hypothetical protein
MKWVAIGLALLAFGAGITAATYWFRASVVRPITISNQVGLFRPVDEGAAHREEISALIDAGAASLHLNKIAALWTAASVVLGTLSNLADASTCLSW